MNMTLSHEMIITKVAPPVIADLANLEKPTEQISLKLVNR